MTVGQEVTAKSGVLYQNVYAQASITSKKYSFGDGETVGTISKIKVAGSGTTFTEVTAADGAKYYILDTEIYNYFDVTDAPTTGNSDPASQSGTGSSGSSTLDKITSIFNGILAIFNKTKSSNTSTTGGTDKNGTGGTDKTDTGGTDKTDPNTPPAPTGIAAWIKTNWLLALLLVIVVPGGIIWGISALVAAKRDKEKMAMMNNQNQPRA